MEYSLESFINTCDEMMIAEESMDAELKFDIAILAGIVIIGTGGYIKSKLARLKREKVAKKEEVVRSKIYDTLYIIDSRQMENDIYKPHDGSYLYPSTSIQEALRHYSVLVPSRSTSGNVVIHADFKKILSDKIYIYSIDGTIFGKDCYLKPSDYMTKIIKIKNTEVGSYKELCDKHNLKVTTYTNDANARLQAVNALRKECRVLVKKYPKESKGFYITGSTDVDKAEMLDFVYGVEDHLSIMSWNLWDYNPQARGDYEKNEPFYRAMGEISSELLKSKSLPTGYTITNDGDWDDGFIALEKK